MLVSEIKLERGLCNQFLFKTRNASVHVRLLFEFVSVCVRM